MVSLWLLSQTHLEVVRPALLPRVLHVCQLCLNSFRNRIAMLPKIQFQECISKCNGPQVSPCHCITNRTVKVAEGSADIFSFQFLSLQNDVLYLRAYSFHYLKCVLVQGLCCWTVCYFIMEHSWFPEDRYKLSLSDTWVFSSICHLIKVLITQVLYFKPNIPFRLFQTLFFYCQMLS